MTSEEKQPVPPEDATPELMDEDPSKDAELEELIVEEIEAESMSPAASETNAAPAEAEIRKLQDQLNVVKQQLKEKEEGYVRLYADFDNFRRRTQREKEEQSLREKQKLILEILPVVDNFERAQQQVKLETDRERELHNSYQTVYRLLVDALKKMGVSRMKSVGQPFNPNLHEAIARQPSDQPEDTVLVEYQAGYKLGEAVVRHAMVMVAAPGGEPASPTSESDPVSESAGAQPSTGVEPVVDLDPEWEDSSSQQE